jgi:hypothetical protein
VRDNYKSGCSSLLLLTLLPENRDRHTYCSARFVVEVFRLRHKSLKPDPTIRIALLCAAGDDHNFPSGGCFFTASAAVFSEDCLCHHQQNLLPQPLFTL